MYCSFCLLPTFASSNGPACNCSNGHICGCSHDWKNHDQGGCQKCLCNFKGPDPVCPLCKSRPLHCGPTCPLCKDQEWPPWTTFTCTSCKAEITISKKYLKAMGAPEKPRCIKCGPVAYDDFFKELKERLKRMSLDAESVREYCCCASLNDEPYPCARCFYSVEIGVEAQSILDLISDWGL